MINRFEYYQLLIEELCEIPNTLMLPLYEIQEAPANGKRLLGLRHDIDSNPGMALKAARLLAWKGICGSFYLLPTAKYYKRTHLEPLIKNLIITGCEIGIHNDVYGAYIKGVDGSKQLKEEISYLRGLGAQIYGTVAHATAALYGAENFEIFKEHTLYPRDTENPIGILSEKRLNLTYEGNFPEARNHLSIKSVEEFHKDLGDIRNEDWMKKYLIDNPAYKRNVDYQVWLIAKDKWVIAGNDIFMWGLSLPQLITQIRKLPSDTRTILVIHPDYFETESTSHLSTIEKIEKPPNARTSHLKRLIFGKIFKNLPLTLRWKISLKRYRAWVRQPLNPIYLKQTIEDGNKFADWIGSPERCLDIGCGNGLFGGEPYAKIGYSYLHNDSSSYIVGIDPLPLEGPTPPWLDEFHQGKAENLPFPDKSFDKVVIATSLDHVIDQVQCLRECKRVMKKSLYIWLTCTTNKYPCDFDHPEPFDDWELYLMLQKAGLRAIRQEILREKENSTTLFLEAQEVLH